MAMQSVSLKAYAKLNLSLNITGMRGHLHTLDMIMTSVDIADVIAVKKCAGGAVNVSYSNPRIQTGNDSVTKAVMLFKRHYGVCDGLDITVEKNIPLAGGLGGSGVDAAGALCALAKMFGIHDDISALAYRIGSDAPYLLKGGWARIRGAGDEIEYYNCDKAFHIVIAQGKGGVLSKDAYRVFDEKYPAQKFCPSDNDKLQKELTGAGEFKAFNEFQNALTEPAVQLNAHVAKTLQALDGTQPLKTVMTGSGSCCAGFYQDARQADSAAKELRNGGFWARAATTRNNGIEFI